VVIPALCVKSVDAERDEREWDSPVWKCVPHSEKGGEYS
jgi:hypothetical protein